MRVRGGRVAVRFAPALRTALAYAALLAPLPAAAQLIDNVGVRAAGPEVEIRIRLTAPVQIVRHVPEREGQVLRITLQVMGRFEEFGGRTVEDRRTPATRGLVPRFTVTFPETDATLGLRFDRPVRFRVRPGPDARTIVIYVVRTDAAAAPPPPAPSAPPPATADVETTAAQLMSRGREALRANDLRGAIESLNQLLNLPPNRQSREAQELIGIARERNGEIGKARAEYELYLKLYPDGDAARRIARRLAQLPAGGSGAGLRVVRRPETTEHSVSGSFSQFYYRGSMKFDATLAPPVAGLQPDQVSLTATDQSSLVSSADLTWRMRGPDADSKVVFRDVFTANYLPGQHDINRLYSLYYERLGADSSWLSRIGRQPGYTGGMLGRFDGLWTGYAVRPGLRVNAVAGAPVEFYNLQSKRFVGLNADIGPIAERWSGNVFAVEQQSEGVLDRRAVGGELRYFDARSSFFGLYDYDTSFRAVNIAMAQATYTALSGTIWTVSVDHRRVPALQTTNVLIGESETLPGVSQPTLRQLIDSGRSLSDLQAGAKALTPVADLLFLGFTHPVTPKLQLGADVRESRVSGTGASGNLPEAPGTGIVRFYSALVARTGLLGANDVGIVNAGSVRGETFRGSSLNLSHVLATERWRTELLLRWYRQRDNQDAVLRRSTPTLRIGYRVRASVSLEAELGTETTTNEGPRQSDRTRRRFFSLGYRWDFF
jgi:tetratricopeptide (TPR) repeat protein